MAPEVMEGSPYNGKVDVYSYGVVLCELFSRHLPFSDRYRAFEFIEAVLEQGETPTIPRWCHSAPKNTTTTTSATTSATSHTHTAWQDEEDEVGALALPPAIQTLRRGTLHRVIMQCLDRDSKRRPSFDALVKVILLLLLNAMLILILLLLLHVMLILCYMYYYYYM